MRASEAENLREKREGSGGRREYIMGEGKRKMEGKREGKECWPVYEYLLGGRRGRELPEGEFMVH